MTRPGGRTAIRITFDLKIQAARTAERLAAIATREQVVAEADAAWLVAQAKRDADDREWRRLA